MSDEEVKARFETKLARIDSQRKERKAEDKNYLSVNYRSDMRDMRQQEKDLKTAYCTIMD